MPSQRFARRCSGLRKTCCGSNRIGCTRTAPPERPLPSPAALSPGASLGRTRPMIDRLQAPLLAPTSRTNAIWSVAPLCTASTKPRVAASPLLPVVCAPRLARRRRRLTQRQSIWTQHAGEVRLPRRCATEDRGCAAAAVRLKEPSAEKKRTFREISWLRVAGFCLPHAITWLRVAGKIN
eukprot:scaffold3650_cov58-Phaeocystis_antarctica.AAC.3